MSIGFDPGSGGGTGLPAADQSTLDWLNGLTAGQQSPPSPDQGAQLYSDGTDYGNYAPYDNAPPTQGQGYSDYVDQSAQPDFSSGISASDQTQPNFYLDQAPSLPSFSSGVSTEIGADHPLGLGAGLVVAAAGNARPGYDPVGPSDPWANNFPAATTWHNQLRDSPGAGPVFNPNVPLDLSQIDDRRGQPPLPIVPPSGPQPGPRPSPAPVSRFVSGIDSGTPGGTALNPYVNNTEPVFQSGPNPYINNTEPTFSSGVDTSGQNPDQGFTQDFNESPVNHWNPDTTPWVQDPDGVWRQHGPNDYRRTTAFQYTQNNLGEGLQASGGRPTTNAQSLGTVYWDPNARGDYSPDQNDPVRGWYDGTRQQKWQSEYRTAVAAQTVNPTPQGAALVKQLEDELAQWNKWVDDYNAGAAERAGHGYTSQDLADRQIKSQIMTNQMPIDQAATEWNNDAPARYARYARNVAALGSEYTRQQENYYDNPQYLSPPPDDTQARGYAPDYSRQTGTQSAGETFDTLLAIVNKGYGFEAAVKKYGLTPAEAAQIGLAASITDPARLARTRQLWIDAHIGTQFDNPTPKYQQPWTLGDVGNAALNVTGLRTFANVVAPNQTPTQRLGQVGKTIEQVFAGVGVGMQWATTLADNTIYAVQQAVQGKPIDNGIHDGPASAASTKYLQTVDDIKQWLFADFIKAYYGPQGMLAYGPNDTLDTQAKVDAEAQRFRQENPAFDMVLDQAVQIALGELGALGARTVTAGVRGALPVRPSAPITSPEIAPTPQRVAPLRPEDIRARTVTVGDEPVLPSPAAGVPPEGGVYARPETPGSAGGSLPGNEGNGVLPRSPLVDTPGPVADNGGRTVVAPAPDRPVVGGSPVPDIPGATVPEPVAPPARPTAPGAIEPRPPVSSTPDTPIGPTQAITPEVRAAFDDLLAREAAAGIYVKEPGFWAQQLGITESEAEDLLFGAYDDGRLRPVKTEAGESLAGFAPAHAPAWKRVPPDVPAAPAPGIKPEVRTAFNTFMDSPKVRQDPYIPSVEYIARNSGATVPEANALIQEALANGRLRVINTGRGADIAFVPRKPVSSIPEAPIVAPGASRRVTGAFTKSDVDKLTSVAYYDQPKAIGNAVRARPDVQERALRSIERIKADPKLAAKLRQRDPALAARVLDGAAPDVAPKPAVSVPEPYNTQPAPRTVPAAKPPLRQATYDRLAQLPEYEGASAAEIRAAADREIAATYGKNAKYGEFRPDQLVDTPAAATPEVAPRTTDPNPPDWIDQNAVVDEYKAALQRGDPGEIKYQRDLASSYGVSDNWLAEIERNAATDRIASDPAARMSQIQDRINEIDHAPEAVVFNYVNANGQLRAVNPVTGKRIVPPRNATDNLGRPTGKFGKQPEAIWNIPGSGYDDLAARVPGYNPRHAESMDDFFPRALQMWQERRQLKTELQTLRREAGKTAPNTPVGTLPGTPPREFGGTQHTNLIDSPYNATAAPLKLEMQYGGLPDAEVARIKAQDAGQGNLFDTGAPKKGITRKSVQNDPMLYSIGPAGAKAIARGAVGGLSGYATGDDENDAWHHAVLGAILGVAAPRIYKAVPTIDRAAGAYLYGTADRGFAEAFWKGTAESLPDLGTGRRGKAGVFAAQKNGQRQIVADRVSSALFASLDAELKAANIDAAKLATSQGKKDTAKILERLFTDPTSHDLTGVFDGTLGAQLAKLFKDKQSAFLDARLGILSEPVGAGGMLTPDVIAKRYGTLTDMLLADKNEIGITKSDFLIKVNQSIVRELAPVWMTLNPRYHINNAFGNLAGEISSILVNPDIAAQGSVRAGRAARTSTEFGTGNRLSDYVDANLTGNVSQKGGLISRAQEKLGTIPKVGGIFTAPERAANAVEKNFKNRIYDRNRTGYLASRMRFELGQEGLGDIAPTLFNDHFGGMKPTLGGLPAGVRDQLAEQLRGVVNANDAQRIFDAAQQAGTISKIQAGTGMRTFRTALYDAERFADSETGWAMRDYRIRSNGDWLLDHVTPLHFWTTHNILATARLAAKNPALIAPVAAGLLYWRSKNEDLPDSLKWTIELPYKKIISVLPQDVQDEIIGAVDNAYGQNADLRLRPWNWINPAIGVAAQTLTPEQSRGHSAAMSMPQLITGWMEKLGYNPSPAWDAMGTALRRIPEVAGFKPIIVAGLNNKDYFNPSIAGQWGSWTRAATAFMANKADAALAPDNAARGVADLLREVPYKFNSAVYGDRYSQYEHETIAKLVANQERLGRITHDQALNALKNGERDKVFLAARQEFTDQQAGRGGVSWAGLPVSSQNDYQRAVKQQNAAYFDPAKSKDDRKAFLTDKQWLTTDWAKDDPSATIQLSQDIDAYFKLPSPKSGLAPEENKRRAAAQKAFIAAHPQVQKVLDNAFAAKTLNIQDYELEVGGRKASDEYYALVDKYGYDDPRVKAYEQKNHDILTAYRQRDMTPDQVRDDNGTYVLMQTVGQYFELPGPKKGETPEENKRRAATQEAFLVAHPEVRQYLNNIEGGRNDQGLIDTTAHKLQLQRQAEYFDFKARGETGKAARALAQSPDIPSQEYGLWDDTNGQAVYQQQQNQQIMGDTNPSGRTPAEELAYKAAMDQLGPYPANGSDTAKELWIANAKKIGWHSNAPADPVQQWFDTHPYPENGTGAEKSAWAVAARQAGWVPSDEDPLKRMGGGLVGGARLATGTPYKTTPANAAPSTDPLKRWMNENPYPEGGTSAQKAAWVAEAKKRGWKSTTTATTAKPATGGGTSTTSRTPSTSGTRTNPSVASSPKASGGTSGGKTPTVSPGSKTPTGLPSSSPYTTKSANQSSAANRSPGNPITGIPFSEGLSQWTDAQRNARPFISTANAAATKSPASTAPVGSTAPAQLTDKPFSPSAYQYAVKRYTANPDSNSLNTITGMLKKLAAKGTDITPYAWQVVRDLEKSIVPRIKAYQGPDRATGDRIRGQMLAAIKQITPDLDGLQLLMEIQGALG